MPPLDLDASALLACAGVTLRSGTLGLSGEAPVGLHSIEVLAELDTDADDATLATLAQLTERYCVVAQALATPPHLVLRRR